MIDKRIITPHKGGRDKNLLVRIRGDLHEALKKYAKDKGVSMADIVENWIEENCKE